MPVRTSVYPSFQPGFDAPTRDREVHVRQSVRSHRPQPDPSTYAPGSYRDVTQTRTGSQSRPHITTGRSQSSRRSHDRDSGASAARSRSVAPVSSFPSCRASSSGPVPSDSRRPSAQPGPRSPSLPVIPRSASGSHPSVHQIFQHPSPPGSQTYVYPPQGYPGHPYSPPQSVRATSPRAVHRKAPPPIPSAPSFHSVGIHASLASGSASSAAFTPSSTGVTSPQTTSSRSRPDVGARSASGHGHGSKEDVRPAESRTPPVPRPPQSEADDDQRLSRMPLLQPRQLSQPQLQVQVQQPPHSPSQPSPPPTHSLDVPQDIDRDGRTPSPRPAHSHPSQQDVHGAEHDQHTEVPVRGKPRIFAAMGAEEQEAEHGEAQPPAEQIFAAQDEGSDEQGAGAGGQQEGAYSQSADAHVPQEGAYTQPAQQEKEVHGPAADGIVRDYPHTYGYPTPRSRSPVLPADLAAILHDDDDDVRGRRREVLPKGNQDSHRISRSLPPTPSPRAPTPEVHHDTDVEREVGGTAAWHIFGLGLRGIFGMKSMTDKQVEKLGTKDVGASAIAGVSAPGPLGVQMTPVTRSGSGSDGRRKLRKEGRRGRREDRGDERPAEHAQDMGEESSFVHIDSSAVQDEMQRGRTGPGAPPTPVTPEDYAKARAQRRGAKLGKALPAIIAQAAAPPPEPQEPPKPSKPYPCSTRGEDGTNKRRELTESVLEKFLGPVGYARLAKGKSKERTSEGDRDKPKSANDGEALTLTLQDLNNYMRGVSMPSHQFSTLAAEYLHARGDPLAACCRAYTRIVLRLRAQAEAEARNPSPVAVTVPQAPSSPPSRRGTSLQRGTSRASSRAPSRSPSYTTTIQAPIRAAQSPLFRLRRAPLLQVFVPSPEGDWLSDESIVTCEEELKKAGVSHLLRAGDVVWDIAIGDEGNIGRMVWDGAYLIDLDFAWSRIGDLPKYLPTLAFPPSYFHRVIRTQGSGNPICHIDIAPWGEEIAANLQLLQDRMKTETPQGNHHTVVRWVHRSSFTIIPPVPNKPLRIPPMANVGPGPSHGVWLVDPGWYGRVVVEAEGTNEGLADLQKRCGSAFPPRAVGARAGGEQATQERSFVFRILREKSRPGEIWIRTVREKERLR
ncbi:uncharacterized protein B0H18DRAFT_1008346 [Fomitopsis serialis]|uniref:uncharacterized protein n=1 Tax=Fomitopsis serialis TaxID=139415 RepID=UPI0020085863|nr:uncharacterized protein B0H18DRAFT_1008346 [Neoantrodia serialis]KAH9925787.1 hypothetical protein B0H18DRAFT_1008346 [Neoantrodia serialis]